MATDSDVYVDVIFVSTDEKYASSLPSSSFAISLKNSNCEQLNELVNEAAAALDDNWKSRKFEFFCNGVILRERLAELIELEVAEAERLIRLECVEAISEPRPQADISATTWISALAFNSSRKWLIGASCDGDVLLWDHSGKTVAKHSIEASSALKCLALLPNDKLATGGEDQTIIVAQVSEDGSQLTTEAVLRGHERTVEAVATNKSGDYIISGGFDHTIKVWNLGEGGDRTTFSSYAVDEHDENGGGEGKSSNKKTKKSAKKAKLQAVTKTPMVTLSGHRDVVTTLKWSPLRSNNAFSASWDGALVVWDLELAGESSRIRHAKAFNSIDVRSTDGLVVAGSTDPMPRLFDPRSNEGSVVKSAFLGHSGWVSAVRWSPARHHLFASSSYDNTVKLWDSRSNKTHLYELVGHRDRALCLAWSGDDSLLASGGADSAVKLFQMR